MYTFENWLKQVDVCLVNECGLDSQDLPDINYASLYDAGEKPSEAALEALENAGYFDMDFILEKNI